MLIWLLLLRWKSPDFIDIADITGFVTLVPTPTNYTVTFEVPTKVGMSWLWCCTNSHRLYEKSWMDVQISAVYQVNKRLTNLCSLLSLFFSADTCFVQESNLIDRNKRS